MKIWLVVERYYSDTNILWGYLDREVADAQADILDDQSDELGESSIFDVYEVEVR